MDCVEPMDFSHLSKLSCFHWSIYIVKGSHTCHITGGNQPNKLGNRDTTFGGYASSGTYKDLGGGLHKGELSTLSLTLNLMFTTLEKGLNALASFQTIL